MPTKNIDLSTEQLEEELEEVEQEEEPVTVKNPTPYHFYSGPTGAYSP